MASNKKILIPLYHDYHLFGYFEFLIPLLLDNNYNVTLITCDPKVQSKYSKFCDKEGFQLKLLPVISRLIPLMQKKILRPFIWTYGWLWSYFISRKYNAIIVPRDSKPFQHMISAFTTSIVCQPGLSNDDKRYLRHIYAKSVKFPVPEVRTPHQVIDTLFGGSYLKPIRGKNPDKYYTTTGTDFTDYYHKLGIPQNRIYLTGNPNYEGLSVFTPDPESIKAIKDQYAIHNHQNIYLFFFSQLEFTAEELETLSEIFKYFNADHSLFLLKVHPRMNDKNILNLKNWAGQYENNIRIISDLTGDYNNMNLIKLAKVIFVEDSNVGILAAWLEKPLCIISLKKEHTENIYTLFKGILDARNTENIPALISSMDDENSKNQIINAQNQMVHKISEKLESPNQKIVELVNHILQ